MFSLYSIKTAGHNIDTLNLSEMSSPLCVFFNCKASLHFFDHIYWSRST